MLSFYTNINAISNPLTAFHITFSTATSTTTTTKTHAFKIALRNIFILFLYIYVYKIINCYFSKLSKYFSRKDTKWQTHLHTYTSHVVYGVWCVFMKMIIMSNLWRETSQYLVTSLCTLGTLCMCVSSKHQKANDCNRCSSLFYGEKLITDGFFWRYRNTEEGGGGGWQRCEFYLFRYIKWCSYLKKSNRKVHHMCESNKLPLKFINRNLKRMNV